MTVVDLELPHHRYEIRIGSGLLGELGQAVRQVAPHDRTALIVDQTIEATYGKRAKESVTTAGYEAALYAVPSGEPHKNLDTVRGLYDSLLDARLERRSPVIAVGGGVIGDTAGFVAASYLRGVPFIQCPTTLLAMVDASVGGKVGVNLPRGKNLVGSFHQPALVLADVDTLATLPARELRCGLAECVKHAMIRDPELFDWIDRHAAAIADMDAKILVELVARNVRIKASVVAEDEKEAGQRAHLNFGHTFAHAIEATTGYGAADGAGHPGFHHGEAVSLGMVAATHLSVEAQRCDKSVLKRLTDLLDRLGLPTRSAALPSTESLSAAMQLDKKVADGQVRLVLPDRLGAVSIVTSTDDSAVTSAWASIRM